MPRGIPNKKKAAKKQATVTGKRKYTRRAIEMQPDVEMQATPIKKKTLKEELIDMLKHRHVRFTDMDGHIAINSSQMLDAKTMEELVSYSVQAINARIDTKGIPYIAVYY